MTVNELHYETDKVRGQARPRFGKGRTYSVNADVIEKAAIHDAWVAKNGVCPAPEGTPVEVRILVYRKMQSCYPLRVHSVPDVKKPDIDNIAKLVLDAINEVAYMDDAQVNDLHIIKRDRSRLEKEQITIYVSYIDKGEN